LLKARDLDPGLHEVNYNLGVAYQAVGQIEKARNAYETFLKIAPESMQKERQAAKQALSTLAQ
jgi:hypothetical protein